MADLRPLTSVDAIQGRKDRGRILLASVFTAFILLLMIAWNFLRGGTQ